MCVIVCLIVCVRVYYKPFRKHLENGKTLVRIRGIFQKLCKGDMKDVHDKCRYQIAAMHT